MAVWEWLSRNLESIAWTASATVAALGLLALLLVGPLWKSVAAYYRELWAKIAVAFFRFVAAASAVASKSATVSANTSIFEQPWGFTLLLAFIGYLLWEVAGAIGDHRYKQDRETEKVDIQKLKDDKDDAEAQLLRLGRLVTHLRTLVNEKLQRIRRNLNASSSTRGSLSQTRTALAPNEQVGMILEKLASLLHLDAVATSGQHTQNFRVGLYAEEDGHLVPIAAFDLETRRLDPFVSYHAHRDRFRLDNTVNPAHAVVAVREGQMLIASDCANHPTFQFFHNRQPNYLKSLVAFPMFEFSPDGVNPVRAVLMIDTDVAGYFHDDDAELLEICLTEFAVRLSLEYAIRELIKQPRS